MIYMMSLESKGHNNWSHSQIPFCHIIILQNLISLTFDAFDIQSASSSRQDKAFG